MKNKLFSVLTILAGNALIAFSVSTLVLEHGIIAGGVSGVGVSLQHFLHAPVSFCVAALNLFLFVLGFLTLGKDFALTTLLSAVWFPVALRFFDEHALFHGYLNDPLLSAVLAGVLMGVGIGMVIRSGASTGGIDVLAIMFSKKLHIPVHKLLRAMDICILAFQAAFHDPVHIIYGILCVLVTSATLNRILKQRGFSAGTVRKSPEVRSA